MEAIREALAEYQRPEKWRARVRLAMSKEFSWDVSAREYAALYHRLTGAD